MFLIRKIVKIANSPTMSPPIGPARLPAWRSLK